MEVIGTIIVIILCFLAIGVIAKVGGVALNVIGWLLGLLGQGCGSCIGCFGFIVFIFFIIGAIISLI